MISACARSYERVNSSTSPSNLAISSAGIPLSLAVTARPTRPLTSGPALGSGLLMLTSCTTPRSHQPCVPTWPSSDDLSDVPQAHAQGRSPSRRHAADGPSPRLGSAIRSTPAGPDVLGSQGANDGCRCAQTVRARFEPGDRAAGTRRELAGR